MDKTSFCGISEHCGYQIEMDMKQHDKVIFEDGYNKAIEKLDFLISEFLIPLQIENVCDELSNYGVDEEGETWCSRNCGVTNCGLYPEMNCYKEYIKMKMG